MALCPLTKLDEDYCIYAYDINISAWNHCGSILQWRNVKWHMRYPTHILYHYCSMKFNNFPQCKFPLVSRARLSQSLVKLLYPFCSGNPWKSWITRAKEVGTSSSTSHADNKKHMVSNFWIDIFLLALFQLIHDDLWRDFFITAVLLLSQQYKTGIGVWPDSLPECESLARARLSYHKLVETELLC